MPRQVYISPVLAGDRIQAKTWSRGGAEAQRSEQDNGRRKSPTLRSTATISMGSPSSQILFAGLSAVRRQIPVLAQSSLEISRRFSAEAIAHAQAIARMLVDAGYGSSRVRTFNAVNMNRPDLLGTAQLETASIRDLALESYNVGTVAQLEDR